MRFAMDMQAKHPLDAVLHGLAILVHMVTPAKTRPGTREERDVATIDATDSPWVTLVWDDPVNLMTYVTYVFQKLFGPMRSSLDPNLASGNSGAC